MRKIKKMFLMSVLTALTALTAVMVICMTGCGASAEAKMTAMYNSNAAYSYFNAYGTTMLQFTTKLQTLKLYDNGQYCLTTTKIYCNSGTNGITFPSVPGQKESVAVEGSTVLEYYGEFTESNENGILQIHAGVPDRIVFNNRKTLGDFGIPYFSADSDNWNDNAAEMTGRAHNEDKSPLTAEEWKAKVIEQVKFADVLFVIDEGSEIFQYDRSLEYNVGMIQSF